MDLISYTKYFGALAAIVILILAIAFILKRITKNKARVSAQHNDIFNSKSASLFIQEVLPIDQKTKVIIIGRDNLRHVILLGENHSQLIETVKPETADSSQQSEFTASTNVGSITTPVPVAAPIKIDTTPEPDFTNTKTETVPAKPTAHKSVANEPSLSSRITTDNTKPNAPLSTEDVKRPEIKAQIKDDLQNDLEFKDKQPDNVDLKDIKNKLQAAKALADPQK